MKPGKHLLFLALILLSLYSINDVYGQKTKDPVYYSFQQILTDTLFDSNQIVSILSLPLKHDNNYALEIVFSQSELKPTSEFAKEKEAVVAINASFFDMKKGGSVTYLEVNDSVIAHAGPLQKPDSILNGIIKLMKDSSIVIEFMKQESFYIESTEEKAAIGTGPMLLENRVKIKLPIRKSFVAKRHPRTCMCKTDKSLLLITIDGRSKSADGMSLGELQDLLLTINCIDAINLDGGGSTTMWLKDKGVVNFPSDKSGERKVANAILVK
ncbi:MAG: phosphodiester glycosidase family protein [Bacteroidota bacterium]